MFARLQTLQGQQAAKERALFGRAVDFMADDTAGCLDLTGLHGTVTGAPRILCCCMQAVTFWHDLCPSCALHVVHPVLTPDRCPTWCAGGSGTICPAKAVTCPAGTVAVCIDSKYMKTAASRIVDVLGSVRGCEVFALEDIKKTC